MRGGCLWDLHSQSHWIPVVCVENNLRSGSGVTQGQLGSWGAGPSPPHCQATGACFPRRDLGGEGLPCRAPGLQLVSNSVTCWPYSFSAADRGPNANVLLSLASRSSESRLLLLRNVADRFHNFKIIILKINMHLSEQHLDMNNKRLSPTLPLQGLGKLSGCW